MNENFQLDFNFFENYCWGSNWQEDIMSCRWWFNAEMSFLLKVSRLKVDAIDPVVVNAYQICWLHDDVIKWKHFPRYWPFAREIHRSPVNFPHKGQWRGTLMFSLIYAWINDWVNNREAGDLRRQHGHYDVIVMGKYGALVYTQRNCWRYGCRMHPVHTGCVGPYLILLFIQYR